MITVKINGREVPVTPMTEDEIANMKKNMALDGTLPLNVEEKSRNEQRKENKTT